MFPAAEHASAFVASHTSTAISISSIAKLSEGIAILNSIKKAAPTTGTALNDKNIFILIPYNLAFFLCLSGIVSSIHDLFLQADMNQHRSD
jgi:hypothetical protein